MRASKKVSGRNMASMPSAEIHISGAEGIYYEKDIEEVVRKYISRAEKHPRGKPDSISIKIEKISLRPRHVTALPVSTADCRGLKDAGLAAQNMLSSADISDKAIKTALSVLRNKNVMRGAALVLAQSGARVEPDKERGVRASRLGISAEAENTLSAELGLMGINSETVREALILASKVAACRDIIAEICISDDPDYTIGYVASRSSGYVRIPYIKKRGGRNGGRVFFLKESADISGVVDYLEKRPVIITAVASDQKKDRKDEIIDHNNK